MGGFLNQAFNKDIFYIMAVYYAQ